MQDDDLVGLIKGIGYLEGLPVVENPGIIDPKQFIDEVINKRLPNPYIQIHHNELQQILLKSSDSLW